MTWLLVRQATGAVVVSLAAGRGRPLWGAQGVSRPVGGRVAVAAQGCPAVGGRGPWLGAPGASLKPGSREPAKGPHGVTSASGPIVTPAQERAHVTEVDHGDVARQSVAEVTGDQDRGRAETRRPHQLDVRVRQQPTLRRLTRDPYQPDA